MFIILSTHSHCWPHSLKRGKQWTAPKFRSLWLRFTRTSATESISKTAPSRECCSWLSGMTWLSATTKLWFSFGMGMSRCTISWTEMSEWAFRTCCWSFTNRRWSTESAWSWWPTSPSSTRSSPSSKTLIPFQFGLTWATTSSTIWLTSLGPWLAAGSSLLTKIWAPTGRAWGRSSATASLSTPSTKPSGLKSTHRSSRTKLAQTRCPVGSTCKWRCRRPTSRSSIKY